MTVATSAPTTDLRSLDALEGEVARVAGIRNAADARLVVLVAEALASGVWKGDRIHSPEQWLMWQCGLERSTAHRIVRLARRAGELPETMRRFGEGRLSLDQAAVVARHAPAAFEDSVSRVATHATVAQIAKATRHYGFDADATPPAPTPHEEPPDPPDPDRLAHDERAVTFGVDERCWWARVRLPVDEGVAVESALRAVREQLHRADPEAKLSWADALVGVAHSALGRDGAGAERPGRALALLHLERRTPGPDWTASLAGGGMLPAALRRYLTCDADVQIVRLDGGVPVDIGRRHHAVPDKLKRLVLHRDGDRCRVPGCDQRLWLQAHHITHWEDGGPTDLANLCALCPRHHRLHHRALLGIAGDANDTLTFTDHRGRVLDRAGRPRLPAPGDAPAVDPYQHPSGERWRRTDVWFSPSRPAA